MDRCSFCKCAEGFCADPCPRWSELAPCCKWRRGGGEKNGLSLVESRKSLVVSSLELGKILAKKDRIKFRASGNCMYPSIRPGDTLHIDPRDVAQIAVGDVAIFRRGNSIVGHRTISKGTDKNQDRTYITTRPDRIRQGDDGPAYDEDVLGVVSHIERKGKFVSPRLPRYLRSRLYLAALLKLWEYREATLKKAMERFARIQRSKAYLRVAQLLFTTFSPSVGVSLRIPISPWQRYDLYQKLSPSEAEGLSRQNSFTLDLFTSERHRPAATMTFLFRPPECAFAGWWVKDVQVRVRYRGVGLEERLLRHAEEVLKRWGVNEIWVNSPGEFLGTGTTFSDLRFREAALPLKYLGIAADGSSCGLRPLQRSLKT